MQMKQALLASSTALALLAGAGQAQAASDLYVGGYGGANWLSDSSASLVTTDCCFATSFFNWDIDPDTGFVLGAVVGTRIDGWVKGGSIELDMAYRRQDVGGHWSFEEFNGGGDPDQSAPIVANQSTFSILANFIYECDMGWRVRPYGLVGVGWARANFEGIVFDSDLNGDVDDNFDRSDAGFAWQLGTGINYRWMPGVDVGLSYRYLVGPDFTEPFEIDPDQEDDEDFGKVENENHSLFVHLTVEVY